MRTDREPRRGHPLIGQGAKRLFRSVVPIRSRIAVAEFFGRHRWLPGASRWAEGLVRDLQTVDPKRYHKLLWQHHFDSYGETYEAASLYSSGKLNGTTQAYEAFVEDLAAALEVVGPADAIDSVFDLGCSVGHVLRSLETGVLSAAGVLIGIDIDRHAVASGAAHLESLGSKIRLLPGDVEDLDELLGSQRFDFSYAAGSLSYLDEVDAAAVVKAVLARTEKLVAFVGLANVDAPNDELGASAFRDGLRSMWTHNFGSMLRREGWRVLSTRWKAPEEGDPQGLYSVFGAPAAQGGSAAPGTEAGVRSPA